MPYTSWPIPDELLGLRSTEAERLKLWISITAHAGSGYMQGLLGV